MNSLIKSAAILAVLAPASVTLAQTAEADMMVGRAGFALDSIFTVGETIDGYTPPGILDGMGAFELDDDTVRLYVNHELLNFRGYEYQVDNGNGGSFGLIGARVSYYDIDKDTRQVVGSDVAFRFIYPTEGGIAQDASFLANDFTGFSRFCSASLFEAGEFDGRGLEDRIFFTGEEDGGFFNGVGGAEWALDAATGDFWQCAALGRGAWENVTVVDTGSDDTVAIMLSDDSSPFDFDGDGSSEAVPMYLYVGTKDPAGDFLGRNGLRDGNLYVWVSDTGELSPLDFNGSGTLSGSFVEVDNAPVEDPKLRSEDGSTGFDEFGYPTQGNLVLQATAAGAFGFSRPEDLATNPMNGAQVVLASTGVDTYAVDPKTGNGVDTFGTLYVFDLDFSGATPSADVTILYDGDADATRALRSPDNLDWADDGFIYAQEDEAEEDTLSGDEVLFGDGAANPFESGVVRIDPTGATGPLRIANIDRSVILDGSLANPEDAVDVDAGFAGEWENSGIIDVSGLFDEDAGTLFLLNVQAHGIEDQTDFNSASRINDGDLVEGGQLLFMSFCRSDLDGDGTTGFGDLLFVLSDFGDDGYANGTDVDGDGTVGFDDITTVLANWNGCAK